MASSSIWFFPKLSIPCRGEQCGINRVRKHLRDALPSCEDARTDQELTQALGSAVMGFSKSR
eukprot:8972176-Pyramimonas_sp.AAC.1